MEWLKEIRHERGFTQEETAVKAKISRTYYLRIENGERGKRLPFSTAKRIADVFKFSVERFNQK